jgi:hypothetical protein
LNEIAYPNAAIVHDGNQLRRKVIPGLGETAMFDLSGTEGFIVLRGPPYDDATCRAAIAVIFGS